MKPSFKTTSSLMYRDGFFKRFAEVFCAAGLLFSVVSEKAARRKCAPLHKMRKKSRCVFRSRIFGSSSLFHSNRFDLAKYPLWKCLDRYTAARGIRDEVTCADLIECGKVHHIRQEAGRLNDSVHLNPCRSKHRRNVPAALLGLRRNAIGDRTGGGLNRNLPPQSFASATRILAVVRAL